MSSRAATSSTSQQSRTRHRSRSQQSRYVEVEKPKKKKTLSSTSLVSIPNTIKLSMLNSGLLSFDKVKLSVKDENNPLSQAIPDAPTELKFFIKLCHQRKKFPVLYKIEFTTAVETNSCRHATKKNNLEKNQNQKTVPYDYNRVVLQKIPGVPDSDYINASRVDSLLKPNAYVVSQGPTEETVFDFWRMVWLENFSCIVMLTKTFDFTKVMCVQYWPASKDKDECYGELPEHQIYIGVVKEEELANFHIRTFRLYKMHNNVKTEERILLQFHYTEWPSHSCPFTNALLEFRRRVRSVVGNTLKSSRPMLVHCNDGGGRSGVFCAVDANIELAEEEDKFHVFGYLKKLRQSRKGLIEILDQYRFVYDTLEEYVTCGNTFFPVKDLSQKLKQKAVKDPVTKLNEYQREYAQICKQTPRFSIGDCAGGHRGDNREKNRDVLCVPPDNFRPYLTSFQGNAFTDYINSVFIDGYTKPREYIVTEWPLKTTCGEFWSLVYDHECSAVVVLCQPPHNSTYPPFWPEGRHSKKYGPVFTIDHLSHNHYANIRTWIFRINKKVISLTELMAGVKAVPRTVQLFQLTCWPLGHKVPTSTNSLVELMNMVERWRQKAMGPVCIVSPDGRSRAGVYCAANACIEQVIQHSEVDVFQAVKTVRRHRPQLVDNMTEYKYCYDLVLHYVLHYLNKENEKKFIDFGRGKNLPTTPDNENLEQTRIKSNTGRIIIDKTITDLDFKTNILSNISKEPSSESGSRYVIDKDGKIVERKKKHRLYSLGGNEPSRKQNLVRMKTVGTLDLCMEVTALACAAGFNQKSTTTTTATTITTPTTSRTTVTNNNNNNINSSSSSSNIKEVENKEPVEEILEGRRERRESLRKDETTILTSISPKRQRNNISSSENSITVDDNNLLSSNVKKKKFRSLSSNSCLGSSRNEDEGRCKSAELLKSDDYYDDAEIVLASAASANDFSNKSDENLYPNSTVAAAAVELDSKTSDDEFVKFNNPLSMRRRTLKKSKKIVRTDSELLKDKILMCDLEAATVSPARTLSSKNNSVDERSTDTVFSSDIVEDDELQHQIDLERLESEYKEHIRSSLQREYKSDGDSLDEVGKEKTYGNEWRNQSVDFDFLETTKREDDMYAISRKHSSVRVREDDTASDTARQFSSNGSKASRKDSGKRTRSEGDKDVISVEKNDSIETQSTEDENKNDSCEQNVNSKELSKPLSLFERRFGKFRKMNKLLKVKRFSTSALYDNIYKRKSESNVSASTAAPATTNKQQQQQQQIIKGDQSTPLSLLSQVSDFSSKVSLTSPKSLKGKKFAMKKRKFSFFGKSQSNNDINLNLKSIASKLSLLSKSNFDLSSTRKGSNLRLNAMGIYGKYGTSNEYRSDIHTIRQHGCTSPLSEAFYNATGSYQLTPMELFEKFCSQDFTGLYKHEPLMEEECDGDEKESNYCIAMDTGQQTYKGAIKKTTSSSLRKSTLLKQNSEPKFNLKNYSSSDYYKDSYFANRPEAFEEEDIESVEEIEEYESDDYAVGQRRDSYVRQHQVEFDQNDQYFDDDNEGEEEEEEEHEYASSDDLYRNVDDEIIDEIYLMPEKEQSHHLHQQRYDTHFMRSSEEILAIDETDEEALEEMEMLQSGENINSDEQQKHQLLSLYEICPRDDDEKEDGDDNLKTIISEYVKNACSSATNDTFTRSKSMDLLSNSSETLKTHSNSDYAFDTVKQINLDSCSTSKLSLSLNSDIFDDITLAPPEAPIKTLRISEIDDFTITPDGSINSENNNSGGKIAALSQMSEQEKIKNELQSQYTIIDCDELEHDDDDGGMGEMSSVSAGDVDDMRRYNFNDEKSSFAEALNKEFDKLFSRAKNDSDTDITTTPSVATTVLTAIKLPSRCSMEKLEPFDIDDDDNIIGGISSAGEQEMEGGVKHDKSSIKLLSQSMTSTTLRDQAISVKKDEGSDSKGGKSKRSHSLGAINKKKSNKCTPL